MANACSHPSGTCSIASQVPRSLGIAPALRRSSATKGSAAKGRPRAEVEHLAVRLEELLQEVGQARVGEQPERSVLVALLTSTDSVVASGDRRPFRARLRAESCS